MTWRLHVMLWLQRADAGGFTATASALAEELRRIELEEKYLTKK